jgi:hypothetical protein
MSRVLERDFSGQKNSFWMLLREGIRKSVKFELVAAPFIIEISATMAHTIAIVATPEGMRRFGAMSALGPKRTFRSRRGMSAIGGKADIEI